MRNKKIHDPNIKFEENKRNKIESLTNKLLRQDEKFQKLKEKKIEGGFFKYFENGN